MSDVYFQERAARRARVLWVAGLFVVVVICAVAGLVSLFYDACTESFDRSPRSVVQAFVDAVSRGDAAVAQECWEHNAYYELDAGCSEICLSRVSGARYQVVDLTVGSPQITARDRANLEVTVSIACTEGGEEHTAKFVLDGVAADVPWKHWAIVHSTFGGTVAEPWCK